MGVKGARVTLLLPEGEGEGERGAGGGVSCPPLSTPLTADPSSRETSAMTAAAGHDGLTLSDQSRCVAVGIVARVR